MDKDIKNAIGQTEIEFLEAYDSTRYNDQKPSYTTDTLIFTIQNKEGIETNDLDDRELKILMIQRSDHPYINNWSLPGGFVEKDENLDCGALRELEEETGVKNVYIEQLYTWGDVYRDPRDRIISTSYMALVDSSELNISAGDDAKDARWFTVNQKIVQINKKITDNGYIREKIVKVILTNDDIILKGKIKITTTVEGRLRKVKREIVDRDNIGFDHVLIIRYALERLKNKVEYTDIMFNLLPEYFTIAEAYKAYQLITGKDDTIQNFRKKFISVRKMLIDTNMTSKKYSPRPAKLYKLNIDWDE